MIGLLAILLLQAATAPSQAQSKSCVVENSAINAYVVQTCLPGLTRESLGNAEAPELQADKTWMHSIPFRAQKGTALQTTICGIDLIDFNFRSAKGVVMIFGQSRDIAHHCLTKSFTVPAGPVRLVVSTQTKSPTLVIRSTVVTAPVAAILQPPIFIPPPPPPPIFMMVVPTMPPPILPPPVP